jgi:hypothetical protein
MMKQIISFRNAKAPKMDFMARRREYHGVHVFRKLTRLPNVCSEGLALFRAHTSDMLANICSASLFFTNI